MVNEILCMHVQEELKMEESNGQAVIGDFKEACSQVHGLLLRLTQRLRYEDAEVEVDRKQAQVCVLFSHSQYCN